MLVIHAAVGTSDGGHVPFHTTKAGGTDAWEDVAATTSGVWRGMQVRGYKWNKLNATVEVPVIDLAQLVLRARSSLIAVNSTKGRDDSRIVMKLDIEASECARRSTLVSWTHELT